MKNPSDIEWQSDKGNNSPVRQNHPTETSTKREDSRIYEARTDGTRKLNKSTSPVGAFNIPLSVTNIPGGRKSIQVELAWMALRINLS